MRTASLIALVATGVLAAGCASGRTARSLVVKRGYRTTPVATQRAPTVREVASPATPSRVRSTRTFTQVPPPPPPPSLTRSYARAPVVVSTPVRRATPAPVRRAAPAPIPVRRVKSMRRSVSRRAPARSFKFSRDPGCGT